MVWIFLLADHKVHASKRNRSQNLNEFGQEGRTWSWKRSLTAQACVLLSSGYLCGMLTPTKSQLNSSVKSKTHWTWAVRRKSLSHSYEPKAVVFHPWGKAAVCDSQALVGPTRVPRAKQITAMPTKRWYCWWLKSCTTERTCKTLKNNGINDSTHQLCRISAINSMVHNPWCIQRCTSWFRPQRQQFHYRPWQSNSWCFIFMGPLLYLRRVLIKGFFWNPTLHPILKRESKW